MIIDSVFLVAIFLCVIGHPWIALLLCIITGRLGFKFKAKKGTNDLKIY